MTISSMQVILVIQAILKIKRVFGIRMKLQMKQILTLIIVKDLMKINKMVDLKIR